MLNKNICPYEHVNASEIYQPYHFYQKIKSKFIFISIGMFFSMLIFAIYQQNFTILFFYPLFMILLLTLYPKIIRNSFISVSKSTKMSYCGVWRAIYDIACRSSLLLRDIDLERKKKYGDIYLSFFGLRPVVIVTSAILAEQISKDIIRFTKSDPRDLCMPYFYQWVGNNNIVLANGERWKETRKLIHPILNDVQLFLPLMYDKTKLFCEKMLALTSDKSASKATPIKLSRWLKALSLDISGEALFGYQFNHLNEATNPGIAATDYVLREIFSPLRLGLPLLNYLPIKSNRQLKMSILLLDKLVENMIEYYLQQQNLARSENHQNLLAILLQAQQNQSISKRDLRNNILALVLASHETTQVALGGVLYYLAKFPAWQQRLRAESQVLFPNISLETFAHQENLGDKKNSQYWKLKTFETLENFILESMRHYSPLANQNPRTTLESVELGGYTIPKGTLVIMNLHAIHMHEKEWNNPTNFNPDRFKKENSFNKFAYLPFGNGPRICSGREFSLIEQKLAVCMILRNFEISLPHDHYQVPVMRYSFTGIPDDSFELSFKRIAN